MAAGGVQGVRGGEAKQIASVQRASDGAEALVVDAEVSAASEVDLEYTNDEVTVANTSDGGTTRALAKGDTDGRFQIDLERIAGSAVTTGGGTEAGAQRVTIASDSTGVLSVDDNGSSLTVDQATHDSLNANANLQIGDSDAPGGAGAVTASTPRTTLASDDPAVAALQVIDDWDESDRAKVNPIVGQAGVSANTGTVDATTQRVTLATDVALPTGSNVIGEIVLPDHIIKNGSITGNGQTVSVSETSAEIPQGHSDVGIQITGTWTGQINFEVSLDETNWVASEAWNEAAQDAVNATTGNGVFNMAAAGVHAVRVRSVSWSSGTATVEFHSGVGSSVIRQGGSLPTGTNSIGAVTQGTHDNFNANANLQVGDADVANGNPVPVSDAGGSLTVDNAALSVTGGGAESGALRVTVANDSTGVLSVDDNGGSLTVDATDLDVRDLTSASDSVEVLQATASNLNASVVGDVAQGGADSGNPVKTGARAEAHGADPELVDDGGRVEHIANRHGIPWVIGGHPNVVTTEYMTTGSQTNDVILLVGAGAKIVLTGITVIVDADTSVNPQVRIGFGTASVPTEPTSGNSVAGVAFSHPGMLAGTGAVRGDGSGMLGVGGDSEDLRITCDAPTDGKISVITTHYEVPT